MVHSILMALVLASRVKRLALIEITYLTSGLNFEYSTTEVKTHTVLSAWVIIMCLSA